MKRVLFIALGLMGALGIYGSIAAAKYQPVYAPDVKVGGVPVGGLSLEQAQQKLKSWWQARQMDPITLTNKALEKQPKPMAPVSAGLVLDIEATLAQLETETFLASVGRMTGVSQVRVGLSGNWTSRRSRPWPSLSRRVLRRSDRRVCFMTERISSASVKGSARR